MWPREPRGASQPSAMVVPVPPPPLLASHVAVRAAASAISHGRRVLLNGDHPPQVAALGRGDWVKLICGASFEDAADVRNLSLVYTLAGVDCIDCAADASVVGAVNEGIEVAASIVPTVQRPWLMISVNDDCRDLHFRKAEFDPDDCPLDCSKPCEKVCPADAISLKHPMVDGERTLSDPLRGKYEGGVITERCYGCGRCLPVCPYDRIRAVSYVRDPTMTAELLKSDDVDAIEIHTTGKGTDMFNTLWDNLSGSINNVKLVAVSLPDIGESTVDLMNAIYTIMESHFKGYNLWQLDGRPMSGDIGRGATRETVSFAAHVASMSERPPGFYQLAGGTNSYTVDYLKKAGLFQSSNWNSGTATSEMASSHQALIGGIAYGGYARKIVGRVLRKIPEQFGRVHIEDHPDHLLEALQEAMSLVGPVKGYIPSHSKPFMKQVDRQ
uniref:4Fe-4S ferredoxin, iron-sulfur binding protein n=1 Tax=Zea mays TaxID=4577 RepID=B6TX88_MAIZE|nr:4Fe-4S ferredoxin, iron-sulfur binding protein [Zea mays]